MTTEHETITFDIPEGAQYAGYEITEIGYNVELDRIYVIYEDDEGWDQLIFTGCDLVDGRAFLNPEGRPAGLVSPEEARNEETPGANEAEELYGLLEEVGVEILNG